MAKRNIWFILFATILLFLVLTMIVNLDHTVEPTTSAKQNAASTPDLPFCDEDQVKAFMPGEDPTPIPDLSATAVCRLRTTSIILDENEDWQGISISPIRAGNDPNSADWVGTPPPPDDTQ